MIYNKGIKPVSTSIFVTPPSWLEISDYNKDYLVLNKDVIRNEVDLFLLGLFEYNDIPFVEDSKASIQNLYNRLTTDGIVLGGGLMFFEGDNRIIPSCCCGLEGWQEVVDDITHKRGIWLGHDPTPVIEYNENGILVWSDDYTTELKSDLTCIGFSAIELERSITQARDDINKFFEIPFRNRLNEIDDSSSDKVVSATMREFNVVRQTL